MVTGDTEDVAMEVTEAPVKPIKGKKFVEGKDNQVRHLHL